MKKVLLVEDMKIVHDGLKKMLGDKISLLSAFTIEGAKKLFEENTDIDAIVIDACVPGEEINTIPLVREFRKEYNGPMIAISTNGDYQKQLVEAGCNERCLNKRQLHECLSELLRL